MSYELATISREAPVELVLSDAVWELRSSHDL